MDIKELESFRLADAVKFHDELNPKLWIGDDLDPVVYDKLMAMAEDFITELGIGKLKVEDITISGSNAAYSYTPHSDIDLHILVDMEKLPNDEVYRELFTSKKNEYNKSHDLTIRGIPVELYVQDSEQPHASLGEYSLLKRDWIKFPVKRKANFDQDRTRAKYEKLGELIELALKNRDLEDIERVLDIVKRYRKAGLEKTGEFGPENLAFKAIRKHGLFQALWDMKQELHSERLSLKNSMFEQLDKLTMSVEDLAKKHDVSIQHIIKQLDMGIGVEQEHTSDPQVAKEIALDHLGEDPNYYTKLKKAALESATHEDYMSGHCHVMALALKKLHPDWQIKAHIGWDEEAEDDEEYRVDHVFIVAPDGSAYDCRGRFNSEEELIGSHETGGVETQVVDYDFEDIRRDVTRGELKKFTKQDLENAMKFAGNVLTEEAWLDQLVKDLKDKDNDKTYELADAIEDWHTMNETVNSVDVILASPEAKPFKTPPNNIKTLYRAIVPKDRQINSIKSNGKIVAFATDINGAHEFMRTIDVMQRYVIIKKEFRPQDFVLDYTSFYEKHDPDSQGSRYISEHEVWMKNTPYYASAKKDEIVFDSDKDENLNEVSGYIPSAKQKNDPRFKTALTVDVKPDSIKKNAKAFGFKVSRAGIPPLLRD